MLRKYRSVLVVGLLAGGACHAPPEPPLPLPEPEPLKTFGACTQTATLPTRPLVPGEDLTGTLSPKKVTLFSFSLEAGQFMRLDVTEEEMDVHLYLCGPDGQGIDRDSDWVPEVPEELSAVAWATGEYRLVLWRNDSWDGEPEYRLHLQAPRRVTDLDRYRVEAERLSYAALRLWLAKQETGESFLALMRPAERYWRASGEPQRGAEARYWVASSLAQDPATYEEAFGLFEDALAVFRREGPVEREAGALHSQGVLLLRQERWQDAENLCEQALEAWTRVPDARTRALGEGETYQRLGKYLHDHGSLREARPNFEAALERRRKYDRAATVDTLISLAPNVSALGEPQRALGTFDEAFALLESLPAKERESRLAPFFNNRGQVQGHQGAFEAARRDYRRALDALDSVQWPERRISTLNNLAWIHERLGEFQAAEERFTEALDLSRSLGHRALEATTLTSLGRLITESRETAREHRRALALLEEAMELRGDDLHGQAVTLQDLAKVQIRLGDLDTAEANLQGSMDLARRIGDRLTEARSLSRWGLLEGERGNYEVALEHSQAALDLVASERALIERGDLKSHHTAGRLRFYENHLRLLHGAAAQGQSGAFREQAFLLSETFRAAHFVELVRESGADLDLDPVLLEQERALRQALIEAEVHRGALQARQVQGRRVRRLEREIDDLLEALRQVWQEMRRRNPAEAALARPEPLTLEAVQRSVLRPGDVLLEYFLGDQRSFVWAVTPTGVTMQEMPPRGKIEAAVEAFRQSLKPTNPVEERKQAAQLSRWLLQPVLSSLEGERLIVVPDGALHYLPFAALPMPDEAMTTPERRLVVQDYEVAFVPSATLVAALRQRDAGRESALGNGVAVFADAVYPQGDARSPGGGEGWQRLRHSAEEAAALRALVLEEDYLEFQGFGATREAFLQLSPGSFKIVHVATHSRQDFQRPELSKIAFSQFDGTGEPIEGDLHFAEIYGLRLDADLVVLSACDTALGQRIRGEGVVGFTRGFLHAGARRVISSLWKVPDAATAQLMQRFYHHHLQEGLPPSAALRQAQLSMLSDRGLAGTRHWAGMVIHGEWD